MKKQLLITVVLIGAGTAGFLASRVFAPATPAVAAHGTTLTEARPLPEFSLPAADDTFTNENLRGHWSLFFFGFTHCPDVCPNTLFMLDKVVENLEQQEREAPQVIFVSVDTQRDDAETTAQYAQYFNPDFIGVSGKSADLEVLTKKMSVAYGFEPDGDDGYTVIHSSTVILIDPQGRMHTIFTPPFKASDIAMDLARITK